MTLQYRPAYVLSLIAQTKARNVVATPFLSVR